MGKTIALIHASRAAVDPVTSFYRSAAPALRLINLLDDGIMSLLDSGDSAGSSLRLLDLITTADHHYAASMALLTCSAVSPAALEGLRALAHIPLLKIDEPMCRQAAAAGRRIAVAATFPATVVTTTALLRKLAPQPIEVLPIIATGALEALLAGDQREHDRILLEAIGRLPSTGLDALVLAQVSMARLHDTVQAGFAGPVYSSLRSSLEEVLRLIGPL